MSNVLVIAPHADDECMGLGATIAKHVKAGDIVHVCILSFREDNSPETQIEQAEDVKSILGFQHLHFLNLVDEYLDNLNRDIIKPLEIIYKKIKPNIVYTCPQNDTNQDHRATFDATMTVCRYGDIPPEKLFVYNSGSAINFTPNYYNVINEQQANAKVESMECYDDQVRVYPHPRCRESIMIKLQAAGINAGVRMAEPFILIREIHH